MNEKLVNRIISVAYEDSSLLEKFRIHRLANRNPEIKSLLEQHKIIARHTHNLEMKECPESIVNDVKKATNLKKIKDSSLFYDLYSFIFRRPAVSTAILSLFIIALISTAIFKRPEIHQQYSKHEIELADKQVKHSLALIAGVFKKTTLTVEKDILTERVSKPIKESFNLVNDYIQGENNENIN